MRKADIVSCIRQQTGISTHEADEVLDWILALFKSTLQRGESLAVARFGTFRVRSKSPRKGRNPRTGEEVTIAGRRVVTFHASSLLKAAVNAAQRESPAQ